MTEDGDTAARELLDRFAAATGPDSDAGPRRYLWTDAFAVCTWLGLGEVERAAALVDAVHHTLGRHREDDEREGWISGLPESKAVRRPTAGGLRIGKPLPERPPDEPLDPRLEWERDGQYFHYLTRWIRALERMDAATGEDQYRHWAAELGSVAVDRFSHGVGPVANRLYWKMSIDLTRPLVPSVGQHDALDGFVVLCELRARGVDGLDRAIDSLGAMGTAGDWTTEDALGAGALLSHAFTLARLAESGDPDAGRLLGPVLDAAARSLRDVRATRILELPAAQRLPFRELGLAIGLAAADRFPSSLRERSSPPRRESVERLAGEVPRAREITAFWLDPANQGGPTWVEHEDINTVMLATALAPDGYLGTELSSNRAGPSARR